MQYVAVGGCVHEVCSELKLACLKEAAAHTFVQVGAVIWQSLYWFVHCWLLHCVLCWLLKGLQWCGGEHSVLQ